MGITEFSREVITSRANPTVVKMAKLADKKYRREYSLFLCEGEKLTEEALAFGKADTVMVAQSTYDKSAERIGGLIASADEAGARVIVLADEAFAKVSTEQAPQGIIAAVKTDSVKLIALDGSCDPTERVIILDSVRDPGNLGTVIRTAAAFGVSRVLLHNCADVFNPKTVRATMGALFKLTFSEISDLAAAMDQIRASGRRVLAAALSDNSVELGTGSLRSSDAVIIGNEGHGISADIIACSDGTVKIPMAPNTESLNASVAAAVIMWEQFKAAEKG